MDSKQPGNTNPTTSTTSPPAPATSPKPPLHGQQQTAAPLPPLSFKDIERPSKMADRKISWDLEEDPPKGGERVKDGKEEESTGGWNMGQTKEDGNPSIRCAMLKDSSTNNEINEQQEIHGRESAQNNQDAALKKSQNSHKRQISWGGTTIEIPQAYEELFSAETDSSVLSPCNDERSDHSILLEDDERFRRASEAVAAAEAALFTKSPERKHQSIPNSLHNRLSSSISSNFRLQLEDLARAYPIESEAETHILKAIEATEAKRGSAEESGDYNNGESDEGVAKLFTPVTQNLLGKVPEGAEGIFHRETLVNASSVTGNSASGGGSTIESRRRQWHRSVPSQEGTHSGGSKGTTENPSFSPASQKSILGRAATTGSVPYGKHNRKKTMEEHLYSLNQAFDTVDQQAADMVLDIPTPSLENLPQLRTTTDSIGRSDNPYSGGRGRAASLDLFNENMARLFQDYGVNDTRVIPFAGEEALPLTEKVHEYDETPKTSDPNTKEHDSHGYMSSTSELGKENDREADYSTSQLEGEKISHASEFASGQILENNEDFADVEAGRTGSRRPGQQPGGDTGNQGTKESKGSSARTSFVGKKRKRSIIYRLLNKMGVVQNIDDFLKPRRPSIWRFLRALIWLLLVAIGVAVILFYVSGNPPTGIVDLKASQSLNGTSFVTTKGKKIDPFEKASHSWWVLYACARLPITFALARFFQAFFIDFLILERRCIVSCMGPTFTLLLVQAKVRIRAD
jgi:hypothetical protein